MAKSFHEQGYSMKIKTLMILASCGILIGIASAVLYNERHPAQPPLAVSYNPYENGIFATGIVESYQPTGSNVNVNSEVSNAITQIFVKDGQVVKKNDPLFAVMIQYNVR